MLNAFQIFCQPPPARLFIVSACSASKKFHPADPLTKNELDNSALREKGERRLASYRLPAAEMYVGRGHQFVKKAVEALRNARYAVSHYILSAGYGLLCETDYIVPYNVTFSGASRSWIAERGRRLSLRERLILYARGHDQIIMILGREYITAIGLPLPVDSLPPTLIYIAPSLVGRLGHNVRAIAVGKDERKRIGAYSSLAKEKLFKLDVYAMLGLREQADGCRQTNSRSRTATDGGCGH